MVVATTIALYASPPSSVCSTPHQISCDLDLTSRSSSTSSSMASSPQKPIVGGLSSLFSSASVKSSSSSSCSYSTGVDEFSSLRYDRSDDLKDLSFSSSFGYSPAKFVNSFRRDHQSPISVLHGPVSCSCSPPMRMSRDRNLDGSFRLGASGLFNGFVRKALGSCVDYELGSDSVLVDELTFPMEVDTIKPYARDLLRRAQLRHKIFNDESVIKAFYEAEKAHRGQVSRKRYNSQSLVLDSCLVLV